MPEHWKLEEVGNKNSLTESCLLLIHPNADIVSFIDCCQEMFDADEITNVHIVFDNRCSPLKVQAFLKIVRDVVPDCDKTIKHVSPRICALIEYLWRQMREACERVNEG